MDYFRCQYIWNKGYVFKIEEEEVVGFVLVLKENQIYIYFGFLEVGRIGGSQQDFVEF